MNRLFFTRLCDKTSFIVETATMDGRHLILFQYHDRKYSFCQYPDGSCSVSRLAPYNKDSVHLYPSADGNPGGYAIEAFTTVSDTNTILAFLNNFENS